MAAEKPCPQLQPSLLRNIFFASPRGLTTESFRVRQNLLGGHNLIETGLPNLNSCLPILPMVPPLSPIVTKLILKSLKAYSEVPNYARLLGTSEY